MRMIKQTLMTLAATLFCMSLAWAQGGERPEDVLGTAQAGDAEAQLEMGILYEFGFYMEGNRIPALAWYMLAAKQGNAMATARRDLLLTRMAQADIEQARWQRGQLLSGQTAVQ